MKLYVDQIKVKWLQNHNELVLYSTISSSTIIFNTNKHMILLITYFSSQKSQLIHDAHFISVDWHSGYLGNNCKPMGKKNLAN